MISWQCASNLVKVVSGLNMKCTKRGPNRNVFFPILLWRNLTAVHRELCTLSPTVRGRPQGCSRGRARADSSSYAPHHLLVSNLKTSLTQCSHLTHVCLIHVAPTLISSLRHPTKCSGRFGCERVFRTDCECVCVYIHLFAQRYPACVRPTGVARLSIVEVNKNPSLTKREQTAAVCSGFPNKHSTSRATDRDRQTERERERQAVRIRLSLCITPDGTGSRLTLYAPERNFYSDWKMIQPYIYKHKCTAKCL